MLPTGRHQVKLFRWELASGSLNLRYPRYWKQRMRQRQCLNSYRSQEQKEWHSYPPTYSFAKESTQPNHQCYNHPTSRESFLICPRREKHEEQLVDERIDCCFGYLLILLLFHGPGDFEKHSIYGRDKRKGVEGYGELQRVVAAGL